MQTAKRLPQVVGARLAVPHALDAARGVAQRDEPLKQLGRGVLDVVQVEKGVVAASNAKLIFHLLAGGGVRSVGRVERGDGAAERGPLTLTRTRPRRSATYSIRGRLAVAGRGDEQEQAAGVGALRLACGAELFGQVVADERKVDLVDEAAPDERGHHPGSVLVQP